MNRPAAAGGRGAAQMKKPKKRILLPRRNWTINPVTRVRKSAKLYSRRRVKREQSHEQE